MTTDDLWRLDASELARKIRLGRVSCREATELCLAGLDAVNPVINAVARVLADEALAAADAADRARAPGDVLGPLLGVPVTTKINTDQAGCPTDNGVIARRDMIASEDNPAVANLKQAGAIIIGRTNAPAWSLRLFSDNALHGRTLNPRDPALSPGKSSGGASAAVVVGIGPIAHGNDVGGPSRHALRGRAARRPSGVAPDPGRSGGKQSRRLHPSRPGRGGAPGRTPSRRRRLHGRRSRTPRSR